MTMIFQLFVFTCVCALGAPGDVPAYGEVVDSLLTAYGILQENVLSMDGNIPALNDSRRHYAAIIHVVSQEGVLLCSDVGHDYHRNYQNDVNQSLTYADAHPQEVIQLTHKITHEIWNSIVEIRQLINASKSDKAIKEEIKKNVKKYEVNEKILLAAGLAATQLINHHKEDFASNSQNLTSHKYVITGVEELRSIAIALKNLYQLLYGLNCNPSRT